MFKKILFLFIFLFNLIYAQRDLTLNFELYQNAANNIISYQGGFPLIYSGNYNGNTFSFTLEQPTVEFTQNYMNMVALLRINTNVTGYMEIELRPSIYVNYSISTDNITAFLQNFPTYINSTFPSIPQWIRDKIIEYYQPLQLTLYPVKILDYVQSFVPGFLNIEVSNIAFNINATSQKLAIGISLTVTGIAPYYKLYTYNRTDMKINTSVDVNIIRITFGNSNGDVYFDWSGNDFVQKNTEKTYHLGDFNGQANTMSGRYIKVLYRSDVRGTFFRSYNTSYMPKYDSWYFIDSYLATID